MSIESGNEVHKFDDDGRTKRTGNKKKSIYIFPIYLSYLDCERDGFKVSVY